MTPAKTYVLRMCGSDVPTKYPNGTAIESDAKHFSVPVKGVGVGGSIPMAFLEQLDLLDKIKVADPQYVHSPCLRNAEKAGKILGQGSGSSHAAGWADKTKSNDAVDLVVTDAWSTGACGCDKDVVFDPSSDDTPLGRAEWIKYISTFFNEENRANVAFAREKAAYDATKRIAKDVRRCRSRIHQEEVRLDQTQRGRHHVRHDRLRGCLQGGLLRGRRNRLPLFPPTAPSNFTECRRLEDLRGPTSTSSSTRAVDSAALKIRHQGKSLRTS